MLVLNVITNGASAMKSRLFSFVWIAAVQLVEQGIPCSRPHALTLLVLVVRAWTAKSRTALTTQPHHELGSTGP